MSKTLLLIYFSLSFIALGSIVFLLFVARGRYYSRNSFGMNGDPQHIYVSEIVSGLTPLIIRKSVSYNKMPLQALEALTTYGIANTALPGYSYLARMQYWVLELWSKDLLER